MYSSRLNFFSLLIISIICLVSCGKQQNTIHPLIENITASVYASGTVKSIDQHDVYTKVNGLINKVYVKEGDVVKKNQPLFLLTNTAQTLGYENAKLAENYFADEQINKEKINQAIAELNLAKLKSENEQSLLNRQMALWDKEIGTKNEVEQRALSFENALTAYEAAKLRLTDLKKQVDLQAKQTKKLTAISYNTLNDFIVTSNMDGKIYSVNKLAGEMASIQTPIATIGNDTSFYIELQVDEYDITKIHLNQKVILTLDSYKGKIFEARIQKIYPMMNEKSKSFKIDAYFMHQPENLYPNISAEANIIIETKMQALTIPRTYLIDNNYVLLANHTKQKVTTGLMDYEKVEIVSGLQNSDLLIKLDQ